MSTSGMDDSWFTLGRHFLILSDRKCAFDPAHLRVLADGTDQIAGAECTVAADAHADTGRNFM